jgi:CubicO group peptidase (beta-lactamase class C family)
MEMNMSIPKDDRKVEDKFNELVEVTRAAMDAARVPGVSIGMIAGGKELAAGLGVTSITNPLPVTTETLFQIGSTTKTFTATAIMRLVEQGLINLDERVRRYLPDFRVADPEAAEKVTVRNLLTHTPGWLGDFFPETGCGDDSLAKFVALMADLPQSTPVGKFYAYNNTALSVAGRVIEVVTGKTYEQALRELVLMPLEMTNSFFFPADVMIRRFAVGHYVDGERVIVAEPWPIPRGSNPAGGITSDALDQIKYMRFQMGDGLTASGERILAPESMRMMKTPQVPRGDGSYVGLTWSIEELDGVKIYSHGGTTFGQESSFWLAPEQGVALTVMTNLDQGHKVLKAANDWAREHFLGIPGHEETATHDLPAEALAEYSFTMLTATGDFLDVAPQDGGLLLTYRPQGEGAPAGGLPPMQARFFDRDRFVVLDGILENHKGEFLRKDDGQIGWTRLGGRIQKRAE